MKHLIAALALTVSLPTFAACYGTDNYKTCYDNKTGNSYSIHKYGGSTYVNGYNSSTGSAWSQQTQRYGSSSYTSGSNAKGQTWSANKIGGTTYDTDSKGKSTTCNQYGCL